MCAKSMWGNIDDISPIKTPRAFLEEQATILTSSMDGTLEGKVTVQNWTSDFHLTFYIVVPSLNGYSYEILTITHPLELYPLSVSSNFMPSSEKCRNEEEYLKTLEKILSSDGVKNAIKLLKSQA